MQARQLLAIGGLLALFTAAVAKPRNAAVLEGANTASDSLTEILKAEGWTVLPIESNLHNPGELFSPGSTSPMATCVDAQTIDGALPSIEAQGSKGFVVDAQGPAGPIGASVEAQATTFMLKNTTDVKQVAIKGFDMALNAACLEKLNTLRAQGQSLEGWFVIQETVRASVKVVRCSSKEAAASVRAMWFSKQELGAMSDCTQTTEGAGVIAYKSKPVVEMLPTEAPAPTPAQAAPAPVRPPPTPQGLLTKGIKKRLDREADKLIARASKEWTAISESISLGGPRQAIGDFIARYSGASVVIKGHTQAVQIPTLLQAHAQRLFKKSFEDSMRDAIMHGFNRRAMSNKCWTYSCWESALPTSAWETLSGTTTGFNARHHGMVALNPAFLDWFNLHVMPILTEASIVRKAKPIYDKYFRTEARDYYDVAHKITAEPLCYQRLVADMSEALETGTDLDQCSEYGSTSDEDGYYGCLKWNSNYFRGGMEYFMSKDFCEKIAQRKYNDFHKRVNTTFAARPKSLGGKKVYGRGQEVEWWIRRGVSGGQKELSTMLGQLIKAYDTPYYDHKNRVLIYYAPSPTINLQLEDDSIILQ